MKIDSHHHLWDFPGGRGAIWDRYLLPELLTDLNSGHNIQATVYLECGAMYRADGPAEMKAIGETEFVTGIAAMSAAPMPFPETSPSAKTYRRSSRAIRS